MQLADDHDLEALVSDPAVPRHTARSALLAHVGMDAFVASFRQFPAEHEAAVWGIVPKDTGRVVGFVLGVCLTSHPDHPELDYALAPSFLWAGLRDRGRAGGGRLPIQAPGPESYRGDVLHRKSAVGAGPGEDRDAARGLSYGSTRGSTGGGTTGASARSCALTGRPAGRDLPNAFAVTCESGSIPRGGNATEATVAYPDQSVARDGAMRRGYPR